MTKFKKKSEEKQTAVIRKRKCHVKVDTQSINFERFMHEVKAHVDHNDYVILSSTPENMIRQFRQIFESQFPGLDFCTLVSTRRLKLAETAAPSHSLASPQT